MSTFALETYCSVHTYMKMCFRAHTYMKMCCRVHTYMKMCCSVHTYIYEDVLPCTHIHEDVLQCTNIHGDVLQCTHLPEDVLHLYIKYFCEDVLLCIHKDYTLTLHEDVLPCSHTKNDELCCHIYTCCTPGKLYACTPLAVLLYQCRLVQHRACMQLYTVGRHTLILGPMHYRILN